MVTMSMVGGTKGGATFGMGYLGGLVRVFTLSLPTAITS
jgi:hypothetical protein